MIDLTPLQVGKTSDKSIKIGITANSGLHTNELICGVSFALADELANGSQIANNISFVWKNDERNAVRAIQVAQEFAKEGINYVIGHLSASASVPASKIYTQKEICFFATGTTHPELCKKNKPYILRFCPLDSDQAVLITTLLEEQFEYADVHLIIQNIEYGLVLSKLIQKYIGNTTFFLHLIDENQYEQQLKSISLNNNNQVMVVCAIHEYAAKYINVIVSSGYRGSFIVGDDCDIFNFYQLLNYAPLDIFMPKIAFSPEIDTCFDYPSLNERYFNIRKEVPGAYFYTSYAACRVLINAMDSFKYIEPRAIYSLLLNHEITSKFWAPFSFDKVGNSNELYWKLSRA
ncbi:MAG: ABC transporter substrate-binding protein [Candidatus Halichondribacter symbioticus]